MSRDIPLVLSLFPGIGLLDRAFEEEGFCVVRGPDLLWGGDVRTFHPPAGVFDGVIGGPPCQAFSSLRHMVEANGHRTAPDLIPEYERIVGAAAPRWFLMENVPAAPEPSVPRYLVRSIRLNNRWIGEVQARARRFSFGSTDGRVLDLSPDLVIFESPRYRPAVTSSARLVPIRLGGSGKPKRERSEDGRRIGLNAGRRESVAQMAEDQGLARDFLADAPFTVSGKRMVIANGVPLPMGRAVARAVRRALGMPTIERDEAVS